MASNAALAVLDPPAASASLTPILVRPPSSDSSDVPPIWAAWSSSANASTLIPVRSLMSTSRPPTSPRLEANEVTAENADEIPPATSPPITPPAAASPAAPVSNPFGRLRIVSISGVLSP